MVVADRTSTHSGSTRRASRSGLPHGIAICTAADIQFGISIIPDGGAGAIVAWQDRRSGNYDIYAQRVTSGGAIL